MKPVLFYFGLVHKNNRIVHDICVAENHLQAVRIFQSRYFSLAPFDVLDHAEAKLERLTADWVVSVYPDGSYLINHKLGVVKYHYVNGDRVAMLPKQMSASTTLAECWDIIRNLIGEIV